MKRIGQVLPDLAGNRERSAGTSSSGASAKTHEKRAAWVWSHLAEIYGADSAPTSEPGSAWQAKLAAMPDDEIRTALRMLMDGGYTYWPNLAEFVKASKGLTRHERESNVGPRYLGTPLSAADRSRMLTYNPAREKANAMRATNETLAILGKLPKYSPEEIAAAEDES